MTVGEAEGGRDGGKRWDGMSSVHPRLSTLHTPTRTHKRSTYTQRLRHPVPCARAGCPLPHTGVRRCETGWGGQSLIASACRQRAACPLPHAGVKEVTQPYVWDGAVVHCARAWRGT